MVSAGFPQFSRLCPEIRNMIWEEAVRPIGQRGVHYFTPTCDCRRECSQMHNASDVVSEVFCASEPSFNNCFASYISKPGMHTPDEKRSTFWNDSGLWLACRESWAAINRRYQTNKWKAAMQEHPDELPREKEYQEKPVTSPISPSGSGYATILPRYDLVHLQPNATFCCYPDLQHFGSSLYTSKTFGLGGDLSYVAIDFDETWSINELEEYQRDWIDALQSGSDISRLDTYRWSMYDELIVVIQHGLRNNGKLFLVDHRLRRKHTALLEREMNFRTNNDAAYTPGYGLVFEDGSQTPRSYYTMPIYKPEEVCGYEKQPTTTIWDFLMKLDAIAHEQAGIELGLTTDQITGLHRIGVMVCEQKA